jgi:oligopeptide/dipeptide ABC transporter ATP-binding protein
VLAAPRHPYTQALKDEVPGLIAGRRRARRRAAAAAPAIEADGSGCPYAARCTLVQRRCRDEAPALREIAPGRHAACHFA